MNAGGSNAKLKNEAKYFALEYKKLIVSSISDAALDYAINMASDELEKEISLLGTRYQFQRNKNYFFILFYITFRFQSLFIFIVFKFQNQAFSKLHSIVSTSTLNHENIQVPMERNITMDENLNRGKK